MILLAFLQVASVLTPQPAPLALKCDTYQHVVHLPGRCANTCEGVVCEPQCLYLPAQDICVDDRHDISERQWQELMKRLDALEHKKDVR